MDYRRHLLACSALAQDRTVRKGRDPGINFRVQWWQFRPFDCQFRLWRRGIELRRSDFCCGHDNGLYTRCLHFFQWQGVGRAIAFQCAADAVGLCAGFGLCAERCIGITQLPPAIARTSQLLADAAIPMMLVLLGLQLGGFGKLKRLPLVAFSTAVRLLLAPVIAIAFASLLDLSGAARFAFILQAGMPTAVMTIVLATEFDTDRDLALSVILTSSFICPFTLSLLIYLLQNAAI